MDRIIWAIFDAILSEGPRASGQKLVPKIQNPVGENEYPETRIQDPGVRPS